MIAFSFQIQILFKIATFENGAMPVVKGNNCKLDCPEKCRWQSWDYELGNWETDKKLSFSCEIEIDLNLEDKIDKNLESLETPHLLSEQNGKKI